MWVLIYPFLCVKVLVPTTAAMRSKQPIHNNKYNNSTEAATAPFIASITGN